MTPEEQVKYYQARHRAEAANTHKHKLNKQIKKNIQTLEFAEAFKKAKADIEIETKQEDIRTAVNSSYCPGEVLCDTVDVKLIKLKRKGLTSYVDIRHRETYSRWGSNNDLGYQMYLYSKYREHWYKNVKTYLKKFDESWVNEQTEYTDRLNDIIKEKIALHTLQKAYPEDKGFKVSIHKEWNRGSGRNSNGYYTFSYIVSKNKCSISYGTSFNINKDELLELTLNRRVVNIPFEKENELIKKLNEIKLDLAKELMEESSII